MVTSQNHLGKPKMKVSDLVVELSHTTPRLIPPPTSIPEYSLHPPLNDTDRATESLVRRSLDGSSVRLRFQALRREGWLEELPPTNSDLREHLYPHERYPSFGTNTPQEDTQHQVGDPSAATTREHAASHDDIAHDQPHEVSSNVSLSSAQDHGQVQRLEEHYPCSLGIHERSPDACSSSTDDEDDIETLRDSDEPLVEEGEENDNGGPSWHDEHIGVDGENENDDDEKPDVRKEGGDEHEDEEEEVQIKTEAEEHDSVSQRSTTDLLRSSPGPSTYQALSASGHYAKPTIGRRRRYSEVNEDEDEESDTRRVRPRLEIRLSDHADMSFHHSAIAGPSGSDRMEVESGMLGPDTEARIRQLAEREAELLRQAERIHVERERLNQRLRRNSKSRDNIRQ